MSHTPKYPYVTCDVHSELRPGYAICVHVLRIDDIAVFQKATEEALGVICCVDCKSITEAENTDLFSLLETFNLACAGGIEEAGLMISES